MPSHERTLIYFSATPMTDLTLPMSISVIKHFCSVTDSKISPRVHPWQGSGKYIKKPNSRLDLKCQEH